MVSQSESLGLFLFELIIKLNHFGCHFFYNESPLGLAVASACAVPQVGFQLAGLRGSLSLQRAKSMLKAFLEILKTKRTNKTNYNIQYVYTVQRFRRSGHRGWRHFRHVVHADLQLSDCGDGDCGRRERSSWRHACEQTPILELSEYVLRLFWDRTGSEGTPHEHTSVLLLAEAML